MVEDIKKARKEIEKLYTHKMRVYQNEAYKDPKTKVTKMKEVLVYKDISCRLSFSNGLIIEKEKTDKSEKEVKLFTPPEIEITEASKVEVDVNGKIYFCTKSGIPSAYITHKEYMLKVIKEIN